MLLLSPLLIPLVASLLSTFVSGLARQAVNLFSSGLLFASACTLLLQVADHGRQSLALGAWPLPYAIEFVADGLSAIMILLVALVSLAVSIYQIGWKESPEHSGLYSLQHALIAASMAVLLAADLFNLYVWFELMLVALLGLLTLGGGWRHNEAAFKYFTLSMLGTLLMLASVGLIHGSTGQLNFDALAQVSRDPSLGPALTVYIGMLLAALLLKVGAFPLFAWLPASYHTLPAPLLALVGGLLTKISIYVLFRLTGQVFDIGMLREALGWLAVVTMVSGVLGAAYHWDLRRILAFHIVSQIGYLLLGLALASPAGGAATGFFLLHNILVKTNLFLIAGLMWASMGHYDLRKGGGLYPAKPLLAALFLLSAFSLVGVPPSSGFWGKFLLLQETFAQERFVWGGIALATGLLTLYSMSKIWQECFWKVHPGTLSPLSPPKTAYVAVITLSVVILFIGLYPDPVINYLQEHTTDFWRDNS